MAGAVSYVGSRITGFGAEARRFGPVLRRVLIACYRNNTLGIAKGAAYSALLSFFPVFTTVTALLVQARADETSRILSRLVFRAVPPGTEQIVSHIFTTRGQQPAALLIVAGVVAVWAASGIMLSLMEGFRAAYGIPQGRPFLQQRGVAATLVFSALLPIVLASALILFGGRIEYWVLQKLGLVDESELRGWISWLAGLIRSAIATGAIILGVSILYSLGPNPARPLRTVMPGAFLATVLWWAATSGFAWYVSNIADYNVLYGSVGAVIALLVWMYLMSIIALVGCEFNAQRDRYLRRLPLR